ncbi:MAG: Lrp/AsnC family transcriptional regulator [Cytophagia bacterium]|nr:MAG: Lrp/AsnC family transcriptional regulator [Cytophagales bacterium]TAG01206.1 MAG: Lrp/AsnC family transcriptional regulator [Cytophagia bacterium]TAG38711.1 MAG: Lrp/AsnC family transcriptional regulator [Cytophagia bacterium]
MKTIKLDQTDRKILQILQTNAKVTNAKLAQEVGLSPAPTLERVKKLESLGIIKSYHAMLDHTKVGLGVQTFVQVFLHSHKKSVLDAFVEKINLIENVVECHHITGSCDFLLKVIATDINAYQKLLLEQISEIEEISNMQSMVILSTEKDSKILPIP